MCALLGGLCGGRCGGWQRSAWQSSSTSVMGSGQQQEALRRCGADRAHWRTRRRRRPAPPPHTTTTTHHASCRLDILQAAVEAQGWRFCRIDGAVASATERQDRWVHWSAHALPAVARDATPVRSPTPYPPPFLPPSPPCAPTACRSVRPPPGFQSSCLPARRAACSCVCMPGPCMRVKNTQPSPACCACCMRAPACPPTWCVPAPRLRPCAPHAARKQVGGLGLTLTAADRVVIVDPAWNPS